MIGTPTSCILRPNPVELMMVSTVDNCFTQCKTAIGIGEWMRIKTIETTV